MTDTNIVERVARAIRDARALSGTIPVARLSDVDRRAARAAIAAMREPTPEMIEAGMRRADVDLVSEYRAMIDAALETPAGKEE